VTAAADTEALAGETQGFLVTLDNFEGPFDLLLSLITKRKLDITEVALSQVTDEFILYIKQLGPQWELDTVSSFLVVAATLLDMKTAHLLPQGDVDNEEDLEALEARDLLFARLLQYRAFKQVAAWIQSVLDVEAKRVARPGGLEENFLVLLPEVTITITAEQFAQMALMAMTPAAQDEVFVEHIYAPTARVAEQANLMADRLQHCTATSFRALTADAGSTAVTVARFLAVLELFRADLVVFEQLDPMSELVIRWVGASIDEVEISDEYDQTDLTQEEM